MSDDQDRPKGLRQASKVERRRRARQMVLQALYQWQMAGASVTQIEAEFMADNDMNQVDGPYFRELLHAIPARLNEFDRFIEPYLDRPIRDVDPIELAILRMGAYEFKERLDVPYRVVINEAVELAKKFGGTDGHKFVNGILDKLAARLRAVEIRAARSSGGRNGS